MKQFLVGRVMFAVTRGYK